MMLRFVITALLGWATAASAEVSLTRLDCGSVHVSDLNLFSDTMAYGGRHYELTASCYLIQHGDDYLIWDTGVPAGLKGAAIDPRQGMSPTLKATLAEQLATLGIKPEQIGRIGISHYHFDHTGQAAVFPKATLLIGAGDWDVLSKNSAPGQADPDAVAPWTKGGSKVEPVTGDKDIFGDGSVTMIELPGHTPGHYGLLVRLKETGPVLLTGDVSHFTENYASDGIPPFNTDRADSLAALDRFKKIAANLKATVIIQHEPADIAKLPAFPKAAH